MKKLNTLLIACALFFGVTTLYANDENSGSGTVAETINAGSYVYVLLEEDNTWLAGPLVPVVVGDEVEYAGGMMMKNFNSPSLERSFESILFVAKLRVVNQLEANAHADMPAGGPQGIERSAVALAPEAGEITPLEGGKTIAEIQAASVQLSEQQVYVRARVMKVSMNILGKNWITLQDGTGEAPDNKLIATSTETASVGDVVTAKGVIQNDVDLGSGYKYKVLLQEAAFSR